MLGMSLFRHYKHNFQTWKTFKKVRPNPDDLCFFPSETYFKYPRDTRFEGKIVLNLGCGRSVFPSPNVVNLDCVPGEGINAVWDLSKTPLPIEDNTFDLIIANHVIEHIPNWFECFKELARVLKPGGRLEVWIPPISSDSAHSFRDHLNRIGIRSFDGLGEHPNGGCNVLAQHEFNQYTHLKKLRLVQTGARLCVKWWTMLAWPSLTSFLLVHLRNIASEEIFLFEKRP